MTESSSRFFKYDEWQVLEERLNSTSTYDQRYVFGLRYIDDLILRDDGGTRLCLTSLMDFHHPTGVFSSEV